MPSIQTILHPTDFSDNSRNAFETACSLARDYSARLIVLHVVPAFVGAVPVEPVPDPLVPAESQEVLKGRFSWPQPADPKILLEHRVAEGDAPEQAILRLAEAVKCDLIVMGTHGRTGLGRFLTGSVAEEVLRKASCPVLAVKTPPSHAIKAESKPRAHPGEIVDVRPLGAGLTKARTKTLTKTDELEIIRLIVPAGKEISEHKARGTLIVNCLEGRVEVTAFGKTQNLQAGELLFLPAGEPHSLRGIEDASILLTLLLTKR